MFKKHILPIISTLVLGGIYYYVALPPIHYKSQEFWSGVLFLVIVYVLSMLFFRGTFKQKLFTAESPSPGAPPKITANFHIGKRIKVIIISVVAVIVAVVAIVSVSSSRFFNATKYQQMLDVKERDFTEDISEIPLSQIPIVDRDTAVRLGSRKIGEVVELVSQFDVSDYYTQINFKQKPVRVSPLQYDGVVKWFFNRADGIPYYVKIDMATQETELVKLQENMKYSPSELFSRDLVRHVRFKYPTKMIGEISFEIDDNSKPFWVLPYYDYTIGVIGGKDIQGIIVVDAITGDMINYPILEVPQWIDRVYPADIVLSQANNWGSLKNGYINSVFAQKNVVKTTDGYTYLALDDDVWLYTGLTSVVSDKSNIGFLLVNMRTKEGKLYSINGAEEFSAMESARGVVQEKRYSATFPILVNIADTPSYFISLKDDAGLVKAYSFVSVANYQIVGVADTMEGAEADYRRLLGVESPKPAAPAPAETTDVSGIITRISSAVRDGNSIYFIEIGGKIYTAEIKISGKLPLLAINDKIDFSATAENVITAIK
ncbi:MAG: CvpA family protein [Oscillospiraceae bacterium]